MLCELSTMEFSKLIVIFICLLHVVNSGIIEMKVAHLPLTEFFTEKPKLVPLMKSIDLFENNNYGFSCNILSGSAPFVFRWFKDNRPVNENVHRRIEVIDNFSMLTLKNLTENDSGTYRCQVNNAFGSDSSSTILNIKGFVFKLLFCYS